MSNDSGEEQFWTPPEDDQTRRLRRLSALEELGRPAEALRLAREALAQDPDDLNVLLAAARFAVAADDAAQATELARQAAALAPGWSLPLAVLAQAQRKSGHLTEAARTAQAALNLDPEDRVALFEFGVASAILSESARWGQRRPLVRQARQAAETLERLEPQWSEPATIHAMLSAIEGRWPQHAQEIRRALERDPTDSFAHNVALMGQQLQGGPSVISALMARLRDQPDDSYARTTLRAQFGYGVWRAGFVRHWWLWPLHLAQYYPPFFIVALPVFFVWRTWRVWRYQGAYRAAFLPAERRLMAHQYGLVWGSVGLLALLATAQALWPARFADDTALYGPAWLLIGLGVLSLCVPAALTGRGGLAGANPAALPEPRPRPRPWTVRRALWPLVLGLLVLTMLLVLVVALFSFAFSDTPTTAKDWQGLALFSLLVLLPALPLARAIHLARFGPDVPARHSYMDAAAALLVLLFMLIFAGDIWQALTH